MASASKQEYEEACKTACNEIEKQNKLLLQYVRDRKRNKIGVVIAYRNSIGYICVGYSKCHVPLDRFNPNVGKYKAFMSSTIITPLNSDPIEAFDKVPHAVKPVIKTVFERARRYFKKDK